MNEMQQYWPYIVAAAGGMVWLIRLEGKVKQVEKTQDTEGKRMADAIRDMAETQKEMSTTLNKMDVTLAGVVGYERGANEARKIGKR